MNKADVIAKISGYDSISDFLAMLRRYADDADPSDRVICDLVIFLDAARVIENLVTEVDCLTAEVERLIDKDDSLRWEMRRLTDKIDDLKEEMRNNQEK
jgi:chaperonin cofactor prefoldin